VVTRYTESDYAPEAQFRRAVSLYRLAQKQPRDEKSCRVALTALSQFLNRHADSENAGEATLYRQELQGRLTGLYYERAVYYDEVARRPEAALIAYRDFIQQCPSAEQVPAVKARIEQLVEQLERENEEE
jgi:outer membrane protein assembly factor BamD (BamD/ComL family)